MRKIKQYVDKIDEELCSAKDYAEKALEYKVEGNSQGYSDYKSMANQELLHADTIHRYAVDTVARFKAVYPNPPSDMMDKWEDAHKKFIEKTAWIKLMLNM